MIQNFGKTIKGRATPEVWLDSRMVELQNGSLFVSPRSLIRKITADKYGLS